MEGPKMYMRLMREREANARTMTKSKVVDEVMGKVENKVDNKVENVGHMAKEFGGWWWLLMEK
jgi:hypothetical protein